MDHINKTLNELYRLDPELKKHEAALKSAFGKIVESKPSTGFDPAFARRLKAQLAKRAVTSETPGFIINLRTMLRLNKSILMGGLTGVLALALVVTNLPFSRNPSLAFAYEIKPVGKMAFGSLANTTQTGAVRENAASPAPMMTGGLGGGGTTAATLDKRIANPADSMMIAPEMYRPITYRYTGDELPALSSDQLEVFKRIKPGSGVSVNDLGGLSNNLIDLSRFSNASARNIEIVEDRDRGYIVNINLVDGTVSISQNWERWNNCKNGVCPEYTPLTSADIPSDEEIIALANNLIARYGISTEGYGAPEVEAEQRYYLMSAREGIGGDQNYVPETFNVIYPTQLNGQTAHELGGGKTGMRVTVNIREKAAIGAWDIRSQQFQSSEYVAETDTARLIKIAEQGGNLYGSYPRPENAVEVELGTPSIGLARMWHQNQDGQTQEELYVPVYIFPVKTPAAGSDAAKIMPYYPPTSIMVPLVQELLLNADKPLPVDLQPMPMDVMLKSEPRPEVSNPPTPAIDPAR